MFEPSIPSQGWQPTFTPPPVTTKPTKLSNNMQKKKKRDEMKDAINATSLAKLNTTN
jgi:hypothetical protein